MKKIFRVIILFLPLTACKELSVDRQQQEYTRELTREAEKQIGAPEIINFQERKFAKQILEMRDKEIITYTYFIDMNGRKHFICSSIGYGLPYSVQFTNPEKRLGLSELTLPQADPNGLFMPGALSATWVLCSDGKKDVKPVYVEPQIMVSPFKMH